MAFWMVRAGEQGYLAPEFEAKSCVAVGFDGVGSFASLHSLEQAKARIAEVYPGQSPSQHSSAAGALWRFRKLMEKGDRVVTYDPKRRMYLVGFVRSDYAFEPGYVSDYAHVRRVEWTHRVSRDSLLPSSRNTLGAIQTLFEPGEAVLADLLADRSGATTPAESRESEAEQVSDLEQIRLEQVGRAHEFIKDRIARLDPSAMEQLVASILRAIGYRARVTPTGPDRGRDVIASPDGLGLQHPRILCEVKHRRAAMGAPEIRSFVGGLRAEDRGLYVSTGGFTRDACSDSTLQRLFESLLVRNAVYLWLSRGSRVTRGDTQTAWRPEPHDHGMVRG
jgi:restriction system protein